MKKHLLSVVMMLLISIVFIGSAMASPLTQGFYAGYAGPFNRLEMFMKTNGASFGGTSGYSDPSWLAVDTDDYILAEGDDVLSLDFFVSFPDDNILFAFDLFALNDGVVVGGETFNYLKDSCFDSWYIENAAMVYAADSNADPVNPTPEPTTIVLLGIGMLGLGAVGRKKIKK